MSISAPSVVQEPAKGIVLYLAAVFFLAVMDASAKWLSLSYPVGQVVFFRSIFAFVPIAVFVAIGGGAREIRTQALGGHVLRGAAIAATIGSFFYGLQFMPLADATAISLTGPLFMIALSPIFLKETVGLTHWAAVLVGLLGTWIIVQPGSAAFRPEALIVVVSAVFYALAAIQTRRLAHTETSLAIIVIGNAVLTLLSAATLPFAWTDPILSDWPIFLLIGIAGGISNSLFAIAFRVAPVSVLAPFDYTVLVWAVFFGFVLWADLPTPAVCLGALMVVMAGSYVTWSERRG
jgi:drug/metabolite transporter (DMT)-like permease